jgi:hypothetical protein
MGAECALGQQRNHDKSFAKSHHRGWGFVDRTCCVTITELTSGMLRLASVCISVFCALARIAPFGWWLVEGKREDCLRLVEGTQSGRIYEQKRTQVAVGAPMHPGQQGVEVAGSGIESDPNNHLVQRRRRGRTRILHCGLFAVSTGD